MSLPLLLIDKRGASATYVDGAEVASLQSGIMTLAEMNCKIANYSQTGRSRRQSIRPIQSMLK